MKKTPIAVLGAGNSGLAMAAHLIASGEYVRLWNRSQGPLDAIKANGGIDVTGVLAGRFAPVLTSRDIAEVVSGCKYIMVTVPANAHEDVARILAPFLRDGQVVVLNPGRTFGALSVRRALVDAGSLSKITIAETQTIVYTCRNVAPSASLILALKGNVPISAVGVLSARDVWSGLPSCLKTRIQPSTMISTSLGNVGFVLHCAPVLLNLGRIESTLGGFKFYSQGITPMVGDFIERLDVERLAVANACGGSVPSVTDWIRLVYDVEAGNLWSAIMANPSYQQVDAPKDARCRYIYEDVPMGLVPFESLAGVLNVPTPLMSLVIDLACAVYKTDFRKTGRTLKRLGLVDADAKMIVNMLSKGAK